MNLATREQVYVAFFALLQTIPGIVTFTRRLQHWNDVPAESQPALYMQHGGETANIVSGQPTRYVLELNLWLYIKTNEQAVGPILNPLLDAIAAKFEPAQTGSHVLTLGGLVHHCWIEGQTQIFEGDLGDEAVAIVPVKILVT